MTRDHIPPDLIRKPDERQPPTERQQLTAWDSLDRLYKDMRGENTEGIYGDNSLVVIGARAAAEWTTRRVPRSPITGVDEPPDGMRLRMEGHEASMVQLGIKPGNVHYARGVSAWMFWWTGVDSAPRWIYVGRP